ncbi:DMT family transporter [Shewanella mesophila]|uniref:DMT family transporter n=1 Tax=Shewanella mesophila TaxID=2864208 RepID=UPI001C65ABE5|nr:DMT family transporter [Shewanella mesophila]QYJ87895.1 DMT family transporter [Shewanella mesophila]
MQRNILIGLGLLLFGNVFSALYDVSIKWLPEDSSATMFLLLRQSTAILMMLPLWCYAGCPRTDHLKLHFLRSNSGSIGGLLLIIGLLSLPLATVSSLFYSAPLMIIVMGVLFLKERLTRIQVIATILGFIGIVIILRPSEINIAGLAVLLAAMIFAANQLALRKLPDSEAASTTVMLYNLLSLPLVIIIAAVQGFTGFSWYVLGVALLSNSFLLAYQLFCVLAYRKAQAGEIAVAEYSGLLFCVFFGWLWFDEWLDGLSWFGAGLIVLPSLLLPKMRLALAKRRLAIQQL